MAIKSLCCTQSHSEEDSIIVYDLNSNTERTSDVSESSKARPQDVASPSLASSSRVALIAFCDNQRVSTARFNFNLGSFMTRCISRSSAAWVVLLEKKV